MNLITLYVHCYIESFYTDITSSWTTIYNTLTVFGEKSNIFSFASSILKNIAVSAARSRFLVKLIYWIALGSRSGACC